MTDLHFKYGSRTVEYRYVTVRNGVEHMNVNVISASINYDSDAAIKRTARFELVPDGIDFLNDFMRVYMVVNKTNYCLGTFVMATPTYKKTDGVKTAEVEAYDKTIILKEDCFTEQTYFAAGSRYDAVIGRIISVLGVDAVIPTITQTLPTDREFEIGTSRLSAVNKLLDEINYNPIIADEYGEFIISKYVTPSVSEVTKGYMDDAFSIISSDISLTADYFGVPNVFLATCENPDADEIYYAKYVNDNPSSPLSTISRGRNIVSSIYKPDSICCQSDLDEYIKRKAYEDSLVYDTLTIQTANVPQHGYREIVRIKCGDVQGVYVEKSWEMDLSIGAMMRHYLVGVNPI